MTEVHTLKPLTSVSGPREMVTDDGIPCIMDALVEDIGNVTEVNGRSLK